MCGIAGIWLKEAADSGRIDRAVEHFRLSMHHRGPDAFGVHRSERAAFVNLRLAIVDRASSGNQPFYAPDGGSGIVYNGEVYNWQELRAPLEGKFPFKSHTDTEVVLASHLAQGDTAFAALNGMFGLCIWNEADKSFVLARDRFGAKPLYVYEDAHCIAFASELKGLLGLEGLDLTPDAAGLQDYLAFRYNLAPRTLFQRIEKLPAGHLLRFVNGQRRELRPYARLEITEPALSRPAHDYVEELDALLASSVKGQLMGEVPIGVLLSGGLDSSSIAAYVHKAGAHLKAYSIGFPEVNEFSFSRDVAQRFELDYVELCITQDELRGGMDRVLRELDEPIADPACFALSRLCQRIREDVTVVLSGEGGDELFAGYGHHQLATVPGLGRDQAFVEFFQRSANNIEAPQWLRDKAMPLQHLRFRPHFDRADSLLSGMQNFELHTWLPEDLMMKADKIAMAHSLEGRFPFLDLKVFEFAARLPRELKIPTPGASKQVLRDLMQPQLPRSVLERPKMGFTVPPAFFLAPLRERLLGAVEQLRHGNLDGVMDLDAVRATLTQYYEQPGSVPVFKAWNLAVLLLWWAEVLPAYLPKQLPKPLTPVITPAETPVTIHHVLCDGGLSNRFNALAFALVLRNKFGGDWRISWPINNWCGASFHELFECELPVDELGIDHYKAREAEHLLLMHENQVGFSGEHLVINRQFQGYEDYARHFASGRSIVYYNNLVPGFASFEDLRQALAQLRPNAVAARRALDFCQQHRIGPEVVGLHIRKTDFGDRVDDQALFKQAQGSSTRFFVCSDDAEVNARFATLPNCAVFTKTAFPEKMVVQAGWQQWTQDANGRQFPFNISRPSVSVVEGFVDQLILSQTEMQNTSSSTFLHTARLFGRLNFLGQRGSEAPPVQHPPERPVAQADLFALLELIRPWQLVNEVKIRLGGDAGGGFVVPGSARRSRLLLSIGKAGDGSFDAAVAAQGCHLLHVDQDAAAPPRWTGKDMGTLSSLAAAADWRDARHAMLKFDVGGREWTSLEAAQSDEIARFETVVSVFHDLHRLPERAFFDRAYKVLAKLCASHRVVHLHGSNAGGMVMLGGVPFPRVLELTWARKSSNSFHAHSNEPIPGALDRPNVPQLPDLHLRAI